MSITAAQLLAIVAVRGADEATVKLLGVGASADSAGEKLGRLAAGGAILAGVGFVALGAHVVKMAADFQQSMTLLVTSAGETQGNLKMVGSGILQMSVDTATGADKLASAMFTVESAGYHGAAGLAVLKAAAEGAKIENADLNGVVDALTTTMHDWREPANQAIDVMNSFREAASIGKMRMDDFTGAMKNVGPVASLAKIPLTDIEAALSTMSLEGDKGASAGTHLAQSLLNMISPSTKAQKVLKEIGLTAQQVSDDMQKSLPDTLKEITDDIGKKFPKGSEAYNHALSDMFGGTRGLKAILELTGDNLKDFTKDAADLAPIMKQNANNVDGWALVQQNLNFKLDKAKESVNALFINIGTQLFPVLGKVLDQVTPLITRFGDWIVKSNAITVATQNTTNAIQASIGVVQSIIGFYQQWQPEIQTTAAALTFFFIPAIIKSGVEAVISAAKIIYNFVAGLILTGSEGWAAAGKLAVFIGQMIVVGAQAVWNAAKVTYSFITSLIATGVQAYIAAYAVSGSFVPALGMVGMQAMTASGKLLVGLVPALSATDVALDATGVAATVALGPIGVLIGIVGLAGLAFIAMKNKSDEMNLGVSGSFDTMGNKIERSSGRIIATSDQLRDQATAAADETRRNVVEAWSNLATQAYHDVTQFSANALQNFKNLNGDLNSQMTTIDTNVIGYWNDIADYIAGHQITGTVNWVSKGMSITPGGPMGATTSHNAEGTDYWQGGPTWIGERGPEILNLPRGSQIIPNNKIGSAASSSSPSGQPVQININLAGHRVAQVLLPEIVQAVRQHTGARI